MQVIKFDDPQLPHTQKIIFLRAIMAALGDFSDPTPDGNYRIEFSIEGKEVDFRKFLDAFKEHWTWEVEQEAMEMIKDLPGISELYEAWEDLRSDMIRRLRAAGSALSS
jgi:hypothetical protein